MSVLETLIKVRELLSNKDHWTKGYYSKDSHGIRIRPHEPSACTFCMFGAIYKVCPDRPFSAVGFKDPFVIEVHDRIEKVIGELYPNFREASVARFNDDPETTHADVLRVLDRAIELEKE